MEFGSRIAPRFSFDIVYFKIEFSEFHFEQFHKYRLVIFFLVIVNKNTYLQSNSLVIPKLYFHWFIFVLDLHGKIAANEKFIFECGLFSLNFKTVFYKIHLICFFLVSSVYKVEFLHSATYCDQLGTNQNSLRSIHPIIINHEIGPTKWNKNQLG